jgi:hypothetical protein
MEELIQKLQSLHGLSADQAHGILGTIAGYIKEKFPMVAGAIDNLIPTDASASSTSSQATASPTQQSSDDLLDKISDFIPGSTSEKIEEFAKSKLSGLFGESKPA